MLLFVYTTTSKRFVIFTCRYFKLSRNTTALSQSNCRNFSCCSINVTTAFLHIQLNIVAKYLFKDCNTNWTQPVATSNNFFLSQRAYIKRLHEKLLTICHYEKKSYPIDELLSITHTNTKNSFHRPLLQKLGIVFSRSGVSGIGYYDHSSLENICSLMIKVTSIIEMVFARGKIKLDWSSLEF